MTPDQRIAASAKKWLKISIIATNSHADELLALVKSIADDATGDHPPAEQLEKMTLLVSRMRKEAKRCAFHGLGVAVQDILPLSKEN